IASTQGRAFWILDDVAVLHGLDTTAARSSTELFDVRDAIRTPRAGFGRSPAGAGQNPPSGAVITYRLAAAGPVTMEFADEAGTLIRRVTSDDRGGPSTTAGLHRYI